LKAYCLHALPVRVPNVASKQCIPNRVMRHRSKNLHLKSGILF
jgi:hypothetical protein